MRPSKFLTLVDFSELNRLFDNAYLNNHPNTVKCVRCGNRINIYNTNAGHWGVCPYCDLIGTPAEHLSQTKSMDIDSAINILADALKITLTDGDRKKIKLKITNHTQLKTIFSQLSYLQEFEGNPLLLSRHSIDNSVNNQLAHDYIRTCSEAILRYKLGKTRSQPDRKFSYPERLILPLSDAPGHWTGFVTVSNEGLYSDDIQFFFDEMPKEGDVGFVLPPNLHTVERPSNHNLIFTDNILRSISLQLRNINMWKAPLPLCVYFTSQFSTNLHSCNWTGVESYKKIFWTPTRDIKTIKEAADHNASVSPYGTKDENQLDRFLLTVPTEALKTKILSSSLDWTQSAIRLLSCCDTKVELQRLLLAAQFNKKQLQAIIKRSDKSLQRQLREVSRDLFEPQSVQVGSHVYVEREDGWYRYRKTLNSYQLASNLKCEIKTVVVYTTSKKICYVCKVKFDGHTANLFIEQGDFNKRALDIVRQHVLSKGWGVPDVELSAQQFKQLTIRLSNPASVEYKHALGWVPRDGAFHFPHFQIKQGKLFSQRLLFPGTAPAGHIKESMLSEQFSTQLSKLYPRYISNCAVLITSLLTQAIRSSVQYRDTDGTFIITSDLRPYKSLLKHLGIFRKDTTPYNWPTLVPFNTKLSRQPDRSKLYTTTDVTTTFTRLLFGGWNALYLNPVSGFRDYPVMLTKQLGSVFYRLLTFYTDTKHLCDLDIKDSFELFNSVYQKVCLELNIAPEYIGQNYLNYATIVPPEHFADTVFLLRQNGILDMDVNDCQISINTIDLTKAIQKQIGFCQLDKILNILDYTEADASYEKDTGQIKFAYGWYQSRVERALTFYKELYLTGW